MTIGKQETAVMSETLLRKSVVQMNSQSVKMKVEVITFEKRLRKLTEILSEEEERDEIKGQAEKLRNHHQPVNKDEIEISWRISKNIKFTCATFLSSVQP